MIVGGSHLADKPTVGLTMGLVANYEDICIQETRKASTIKEEFKSVFFKVGLYQTGYL